MRPYFASVVQSASMTADGWRARHMIEEEKGRWRKKREKGERLARTTTIFDYAVTLFDHGKSIINMLLKHTRPQDSVKVIIKGRFR